MNIICSRSKEVEMFIANKINEMKITQWIKKHQNIKDFDGSDFLCLDKLYEEKQKINKILYGKII